MTKIARVATGLVLATATGCAEITVSSAMPNGPLPGVLQLENYAGALPAVLNAVASPDVRWNNGVDDVVKPPQPIVAPDTVEAGEPFQVVTYTIGENGCWSAGDQQVTVGTGVVELRPFDVHSGNDICTLMLSLLSHTSVLSLTEPGEWTLRVIGRRVRAGVPSGGSAVSAEKTIVVR